MLSPSPSVSEDRGTDALMAARAERPDRAAAGGAAGQPRELVRAAPPGSRAPTASLRDRTASGPGARRPLQPVGAPGAVEAEDASTCCPGADQQFRGVHGGGAGPVSADPVRSRPSNLTGGHGMRETHRDGWFDALAHTVTVDGDWPRCAECDEYGSHEECQPEQRSSQREQPAVAS